jgi:hypothetical protein
MVKHNLIYGIFYGAVLLVLLAMPFAFGEDVSTSVAIGNSPPVVGTVTSSDDFAPPTCGNVTAWCNATITDANGYNDIKIANATLWDPASTTIDGSDDNSTHYVTRCFLNGGSGSAINANCSFAIVYHANPAEWTCRIYANDTSSNVHNNSKTDVTIITLRALDANNTISFGTLSPGTSSTADANNTILNCGNVPTDLNLSGTDLTNATASVTNISVGNVKYNITTPDQQYTTSMTSLSATSTYTNFTLTKRTSGLSLNNTYWKIGIPASIENLVFTGTITFTAVPDT